jgi:hypothetical protein
MPKQPPRKVATWDEEVVVEIPLPYSGKVIQLFDRIKVKVPFKKMRKIMDGEEIVLSDETKAIVEVEHKVKGCFLCGFILEDFAKNGKLTGFPNDIFDKGTFPIEAKIRHIEIMKYHLPEKKVGAGAEPQPPEDTKEETDAE